MKHMLHHRIRHTRNYGSCEAEEVYCICAICKQAFSGRDEFLVHLETIHSTLLTGHKCPECIDIFKSKIKLTKHKFEVHNIDKRFKCNACDRVFNGRQSLQKHMKVYHKLGNKVKCPMCEYETFDEFSIKKHSSVHETTRAFHCKFCQKSFKTLKNLGLHERIHTGDKRSVCGVCKQAFVQKASLNYHMEKYHPGVQF